MRRSALTAPIALMIQGLLKQTARSLCCAVLVMSVVTTGAFPAMAQNATAQTATRQFDIPAGALGSALLRFGEQSGLQFSVGSEMTRGKRTAGIKGKFTPEDGLRALLGGTGLTFRFTGPRTVVVEPLPDTGEARVLGPLRVEGADQGSAVSGINGSTDSTATESTGSYTTGALSIASKTPLSIKDTPKTVSVITNQQLADQNITDFTSAMEQATGITVRNGPDNLRQDFYSRGFEVNTFRIDGGGPVTTDWFFVPMLDMAMYDHIEITRGADGLYSGYGNPGGVVNLARKRPLDHQQVLVEAQMGSWNDQRVAADVTGPLGFDGRLRGRLVLSYEDKDFFYDTAHDNHTLAYGILEADITPDLVVRGGFSLTNQRSTPWVDGLPRYRTGESLGLPRSTCLCFQDSYYTMTTKEYFLQADYQINPDWKLNVNLTQLLQNNNTFVGEANGAVDPNTGYGWGVGRWHGYDRNPDVNTFDSSLTGVFDLFGLKQSLAVGANYQEAYSRSIDSYGLSVGRASYYGYRQNIPPGDLADFYGDPLNFDPRAGEYKPYSVGPGDYYDEGQKQYTVYANWSTELWDRLHINLGLRYSAFETHGYQSGFCRSNTRNFCLIYQRDAQGNLVRDEDGELIVIGQIPVGTSFEGYNPPGWDRTSNKDTTFSWPPTWSLAYDLTDNWSVYGSYSDVYVSQANNVDVDHKPLPPVTGFNAEFGTKFMANDGKLNVSFAGYYIKQEGFAALLYDDFDYNDLPGEGVCCFIGGDQTKNISYGFDAEMTGELIPGLQVSAGYTFNRNKNEYNYPEWELVGVAPLITFAPKHLLKVWANYQFDHGWARALSIGAGFNAQTSTYTSGSVCTSFDIGVDPVTGDPTSECNANEPFDFRQGFYSVFAAKFGYQLNPTWNIALNLDNLFDRVYYRNTGGVDNGNWYGEPRSYSVVLRGKF